LLNLHSVPLRLIHSSLLLTCQCQRYIRCVLNSRVSTVWRLTKELESVIRVFWNKRVCTGDVKQFPKGSPCILGKTIGICHWTTVPFHCLLWVSACRDAGQDQIQTLYTLNGGRTRRGVQNDWRPRANCKIELRTH